VNYNQLNYKLLECIHEKVLQLTFTANELKPMSKEINSAFQNPITWNDKQRYLLQCELDAIFAHLYILEKAELDYILGTFPIVKRKDIAKYGSYRTKETILQLYDEFAWVREEIKH
jgi:hypothetical protein